MPLFVECMNCLTTNHSTKRHLFIHHVFVGRLHLSYHLSPGPSFLHRLGGRLRHQRGGTRHHQLQALTFADENRWGGAAVFVKNVRYYNVEVCADMMSSLSKTQVSSEITDSSWFTEKCSFLFMLQCLNETMKAVNVSELLHEGYSCILEFYHVFY